MEKKDIDPKIELFIFKAFDDFKEWARGEFAGKKTELIVYSCVGLILTSVVVAVIAIVTKKISL